MKLYHVQYDSVSYWVEAASFAAAVEQWKRYVAQEWGTDYDGTEEPESVALIHDEPVIHPPPPGFVNILLLGACQGAFKAFAYAPGTGPEWYECLRTALDSATGQENGQPALTSVVAGLVAALKSVEWSGSQQDEDGADIDACPWCGGLHSNGHLSHCKVAAAIKAAESMPWPTNLAVAAATTDAAIERDRQPAAGVGP